MNQTHSEGKSIPNPALQDENKGVSAHMAVSLLAFLFFLPMGLLANHYGRAVLRHKKAGEWKQARAASQKALRASLWGIGIGLLLSAALFVIRANSPERFIDGVKAGHIAGIASPMAELFGPQNGFRDIRWRAAESPEGAPLVQLNARNGGLLLTVLFEIRPGAIFTPERVLVTDMSTKETIVLGEKGDVMAFFLKMQKSLEAKR